MEDEAPEASVAGSVVESVAESVPQATQPDIIVGSVGHILRRAFQDLFAPPEAPPPAEAASDGKEGDGDSQVGAGSVPDDDLGKEAEAETAGEGDADLEEHKSVAASSVASGDPIDPRAAEELAAIDARVGAVNQHADALEAYLRDAARVASELDVKERAALRARGLVLGTEVPMGPSHLNIDPVELQQVDKYGDLADGLLQAATIMRAHQYAAKVRSGNAGKVGEVAPDFVATTGDPHYLAATNAQNQRFTTNKRRYGQTGTFGRSKAPGGGGQPSPAPPLDGDDFDEEAEFEKQLKRRMAKTVAGAAEVPRHVKDVDDVVSKRMTHKLNFKRNPRHAHPPSATGVTAAKAATLKTKTLSAKSSHLRAGDTMRAATAAAEVEVARGGEAIGGPFAVEPGTVLFDNYRIDEEVSTTVVIRNQDAVSRSLRLLPPSTAFFSMDTPVYPGKSQGQALMAPGMSVKVTIRFCANSLAEFEDALTLVTEAGPFRLPLRAALPAPMLTLPYDLDAGVCLPGDDLTETFRFANTGPGAGRFRVFSEDDWPAVAPGPAVDPTVSTGPFVVSPSAFAVPPGGAAELSVRFMPSTVGSFTRKIYVLCDNCDVTTHTLVGTSTDLAVSLAGVEGTETAIGGAGGGSSSAHAGQPVAVAPPAPPAPEDGTPAMAMGGVVDGVFRAAEETKPSAAPARLVFGACHPGAPATKTVAFANNSPLPLAFRWEPDPWWSEKAGGPPPSDPAYTDSVFTVTPSEGVLPPHGECTFEVAFDPADVMKYRRVYRLMALDVPVTGSKLDKAKRRSRRRLLGGDGDGDGDVAGVLRHTVPVAAAFCCGSGQAPDVTATPPVVSPGVLPGGTSTSTVALSNLTPVNVRVVVGEAAWASAPAGATSSPAVRVSPPEVTIPGGGSVEVEVAVCGAEAAPGTYVGDVPMKLTYGAAPGGNPHLRHVQVVAAVGAPTVVLEEPEIDLGLMAVSDAKTATLHVRNASDVPAAWALDMPTPREVHGKGAPRRTCGFEFSPASGELPAGGVATVTLTCRAGPKPFRVRDMLRCTPAGGQAACIRVRGEVQSPVVFLSADAINFGVSFLTVDVTRFIDITNVSNLPAKFSFDNLLVDELEPEPLYRLKFSPPSGTLPAKSSRTISVTLTGMRQGGVDAFAACDVVGMPRPLGLAVRGTLKGLVVAWSVSPEKPVLPRRPAAAAEAEVSAYEVATRCGAVPGEEPGLEFGDMPRYQRRRLYVTAHNLSGLPTDVGVAVEAFPVPGKPTVAALRQRLEEEAARRLEGNARRSANPLSTLQSLVTLGSPMKSNSTLSRLGAAAAKSPTAPKGPSTLLGRGHEATQKFQTKAGAGMLEARAEEAFLKEQLSFHQGVAFWVDNDYRYLPAWGVTTFMVQVAGDMPGGYGDALRFLLAGAVDELTVGLPMTCSVTGNPLSFNNNVVGMQLAGAHPSLSFGELPIRSAPVSRVVRINNTGAQDALMALRLAHHVPPPKTVAFVGVGEGEAEEEGVDVEAEAEAGVEVEEEGALGKEGEEVEEASGTEGEKEEEDVGGKDDEGGEGGEGGEDGGDGKDDAEDAAGPSVPPSPAVSVAPSSASTTASARRAAAVAALPPPPFSLDTHLLCVPSRGYADVTVTADPAPMSAEDSAAFEAVGLKGIGGQRVVVLSADVKWLKRGTGQAACDAGDDAWVNSGPVDGPVDGTGTPDGTITSGAMELRLRMTPLKPRLVVDKRASGDGGQWIKFGVWANMGPGHPSFQRSITLTNTTAAPLTFAVDTSGPFAIKGCTTNAPKHPLSTTSATYRPLSRGGSRLFTLTPHTNLVVDVAFQPQRDTKPLATTLFGTGTFDLDTMLGDTTAPAGGAGGDLGATASVLDDKRAQLREEYAGHLTVTFANETVQHVLLRCDKLRPMVTAAPPQHDFEGVHVERWATAVVHVANPTVVDAEWEVRHMGVPPRKPRVQFDAKALGLTGKSAAGLRLTETPREEDSLVDDPSVFEFQETSGVLKGPTAPLDVADAVGLRDSNGLAPLLALKVKFKPKENVRYRSRYRINVRKGEGFDVVLFGRGTYEEWEDK